jgi:DNA-directed DNA polymerase III PolC
MPAHLHVHSHYSLLSATPSVTALAARAAAEGHARLPLTDTNALYGLVAFARACHTHNVLPIAGMALTVAAPDAAAVARAGDSAPVDHVVLLARDAAGYRSLCRLSSAIQAQPQREQFAARGVAWSDLAANRAGLLCICGGRRSLVEHELGRGRAQAAGALLARYAGLFDEDCVLALELHTAADLALGRAVVALAARFGVEAAAVQPIYTLEAEERATLRVLAAIERNCTLDALDHSAWHGENPAVALHWPAPGEMAVRYAEFAGPLAASTALLQRCAPFAVDATPVWPVLPLPPGQTADAALVAASQEGAARRFGDDEVAEHRLIHELEAITRRGFAPFFLIVAGIVAYARQQGIPVSTRGSVANSLVAYCLDITTVDPLANDLLFERFLNPARSGLPDIDLDFCSRRRDEVLDYVRQTYGADHVALVATVSTLRLRSAVRETGKAFALDDEAIDRLVKLLPDSWHPDPRRRVRSEPDDVISQLSNAHEREAVRFAYRLVGQPDHLSVHPGGVVITPGPLTDHVPVQWAPKGFLVTQYDHDDIEAIGLPKLDLLGIRALTVLADAVALVARHAGVQLAPDDLPLDDGPTGDLLACGATVGVFQCESSGAQRTLRQLKARTVRDLAVANAFFKPGPASGGMAVHFVRRYRGEEAVEYLHPALEPILQGTRGVLLFQEQILRVAREVAGLTWEEADHLRRGMSRFRSDEMDAMRASFVTGCMREAPAGPGFARKEAETLWDQVKAFAGYGFNQGHATAYAGVSYRSAYLKAHWPAAFLCARLADWGGFYHQAVYIAEARRLGITVCPPHVNHGAVEFDLAYLPSLLGEDAPRRPVLWMGLSQVRDLRRSSIAALLAARAARPFGDLADLLRRVPLQNKEAVNLIRCGALDGLGRSRAALLAELARIERGGLAQIGFAFLAEEGEDDTVSERLAWEEQLLGLPVSVHPLAALSPAPEGFTVSSFLARMQAVDAATGRHAALRGRGPLVTVAGVRLPGWTGGAGFFLADEHSYLVAEGPRGQRSPKPWQPVEVVGRRQIDEWGGEKLQFESLRVL